MTTNVRFYLLETITAVLHFSHDVSLKPIMQINENKIKLSIFSVYHTVSCVIS